MSARAHGGRRRRDAHAGGHNDERWLLTYSDMITLLMALFIIMWAVSTVNDAKFDQLAKSLSEAFNGDVFQGNKQIVEGTVGSKVEVVPVSQADTSSRESADRASRSFDQALADAAAARETEDLTRLKAQIDAYAGDQGLSGKIKTSIDERGLVIRILPDDMLFDTGEADLRPDARPILDHLAYLLKTLPGTNPIRVEGNTDDVPISTARFRSNWDLSAARAVTVLEVILADGLDPKRLSATGYADQKPVATNATAEGRALNRRVEIVVQRQASAPDAGAEGEPAPATTPTRPPLDIIAPIGEEVLP